MTTSTKTGGSVDYYTCSVPAERTIDGRPGYDAQCLEIIETLGMSFAEGEAFKAIWRSCAARTLGKVKADCDALYNAEKVAFYGQRMVVEAKVQGDLAEGLIDATCEAGADKFDQSEWGKSELQKIYEKGAMLRYRGMTGRYYTQDQVYAVVDSDGPDGFIYLEDDRSPRHRWTLGPLQDSFTLVHPGVGRPLAGS